jgi:RNA polymerase sigma-70 factor (ECF subfamily)
MPDNPVSIQIDFRAVYDEYFDFVWRSLRRLGVASSDIADAVQEVFLVVHRRLSEFEGRARVTTWLYRICLRVASDRRRRAYVRREEPSDVEALEPTDIAMSSEDQLVKDEELQLLENALGALSLEQRAVFTLFEFERLSGDDIAATLEIPLGTVYSRLRLGREAFHKVMQRELARRNSVPVVRTRSAASGSRRREND